jgi:hypothetical protein
MPEADLDRWLTYAEVGNLLGISASAARMHAKRRGWQRRSPNAVGAHAMVLVPPDVAVQPRAAAESNGETRPSLTDTLPVLREFVREIVAPLAAQLEHERRRADDAVAAERISAGEAAALRAELARRQDWSVWRRLRWALGTKP